MTQQQVLDILTRLSQQRPVTSQELTDLSMEILSRSSSYLNNTLNGTDEPSFDINTLKKYIEQLKDVNTEIQNITNAKGVGAKYTKSEQKRIDDLLKKQAELNKRISERREIDYLIKKSNEDINKEYEKQERALNKQIQLQNLEKKEIKEGLTWEEKRYRLLTKLGEQIGINTDKFSTGVGEIKKGVNEIKSGVSSLKGALDKFNDAWGRVDQAAADFTKRIGGSKASMEALRKSTIDFMETRNIGIKYNTSMEELIKLQSDYNASIGRSIDLTNDQKETFAAMKSAVGEQAAMEFSTKLENFGLNPDEVGERVGQMFSKASKSGVAFEKFSKNVLDNIKLAQNYNFKNGVNGLISMAKKATEIKMDMQQVARFADKVSTLEGAVQAGANLSVLGGSFAQYGNPLQMLYEGLNDMEGLQDRMINMFGNLGKWDYSKGQVDVSVYNKQRIKAAAEATGMDFSALMEQINASARRNIVEGKLGSQYNNDKEFKELLLNKAQLDEKGNAYVTINGERKDVNNLTAQDKDYLKAANNSDSDNIAEIAVNTRGFKDITEGLNKQKDVGTAQVNEITGIGNATKNIMANLGENTTVMRTLGTMGPVVEAIKGINSAILGFVAAIAGAVTIGKAFGGGGIPNGKNVTSKLLSNSKIGKNGALYYKTGKGATGYTRLGKNASLGTKMNAGFKMGKGLARGGGVIAGLTTGAITGYEEYNNKTHSTGEKIGNTLAKGAGAGLGAWGGAALGAAVGTALIPIPGVGTTVGALIGGGLGTLVGEKVGGLTSNLWNKDEERNKLHQRIQDIYNTDVSDNYTPDELKIMTGEKFGDRNLLKQKMKENNDFLPGFKNGGYTGEGGQSEIAGIVHKGEIVIPSSAVKASGNLMNPITVSSNKQYENNINNNEALMKVDPININLSGDLRIGGEKVDTQKILESITPQLIDRINDCLVDRRNFRIDRNKTHMKYRT